MPIVNVFSYAPPNASQQVGNLPLKQFSAQGYTTQAGVSVPNVVVYPSGQQQSHQQQSHPQQKPQQPQQKPQQPQQKQPQPLPTVPLPPPMPQLHKDVVIDGHGVLINKLTGEPVDTKNNTLPKGLFMNSQGMLVDFKKKLIYKT